MGRNKKTIWIVILAICVIIASAFCIIQFYDIGNSCGGTHDTFLCTVSTNVHNIVAKFIHPQLDFLLFLFIPTIYIISTLTTPQYIRLSTIFQQSQTIVLPLIYAFSRGRIHPKVFESDRTLSTLLT